VDLFEELSHKLDYLSNDLLETIQRAYQIAKNAHQGQLRTAGDPYITHPLAVAGILADMHMDQPTLIAALLHDVIEDTPVTKEELTQQFGAEVSELVDGVSKLTQIEFSNKAEAHAENFRKMVLAMARDIRVIIIKLADRLHNMRTLEPLPLPKQRRIARETLDIFAPLANRLGMHEISLELEELSFARLYPLRYRVLEKAIADIRGNRKEIMGEIQAKLTEGLKKSQLLYYEITGRAKHLYSIYKKMRGKHTAFEDIMDVYAFRVVVDSVDSCYRALGVAHSLYKPIPERFKDYIAIPKANGYQSLHTTLFGAHGLPIEIQIRTREMEQMASSGIAAHWLYKLGEEAAGKSQLRAQRWVKNLLEMQQRTGSSLEFIENVRIDLFPDEVYVFTPQGDIMELPIHATPVDFAYAVHTDVGNTCVAARIDRQLAPISTPLISGQTVEIITAPGARPNPAWLRFVTTAKARSGIRHFIKTQQRAESIVLGEQLLNKALAKFGLTVKKLPATSVELILQEMKFPTVEDLLEDIGLGNRIALLVANRLLAMMEQKETHVGEIPEPTPLIIHGTEGMVVNFASCCYPIPGDAIVGVLSTGQGIIVHIEHCPHIAKLRRYPERWVPVRWAEQVQGEFMVPIRLEIINQRGVLANLALVISQAGGNIDDINVDERGKQHYLVTIKLLVQDRVHLANILRQLRRLKQIIKITRGKL
jgi:guanosine-3',5'-bis(diphosphate) 3'-pyrophosphohydrolase